MNDKRVVYYSIVKKDDIKIDNSIDKLETNLAIYVLKNQLKCFNLELPEIYLSKNGKPYFKDSNIFFNYSHSNNYIASAISFYEVGIDIEELNRKISDSTSKKYLDNVVSNKKRIETWVKKESYSKLKGLGLQIKFQDIKLNEINSNNYFISTNKYMCSIYCDNDNVVFKELNIDD